MSNSAEAVHRRTFHTHSYEVDQSGKARPDILLSFMLDTAWSHTKDTEFSYSDLKNEGQLWVLSRFFAMFHDIPKWNDEITVETWGKGIDKLFGLRDFIVYSNSNRKLISATSAWLIIDRKTARIQRIESLGRNFPMQLERNELNVRLEKIDQCTAEKTGFECIVRYSDLDVNRHVNSSRYVQWIFDSYSKEFLEEKSPNSLEINYLSEAKLGDEIFVLMTDVGKFHYCEIRRGSGGSDLCRAKITWDNKK